MATTGTRRRVDAAEGSGRTPAGGTAQSAGRQIRSAPGRQKLRTDEGPEVVIPPALGEAVGYVLRLAQEASFDAYLRRVGNPDLKPGRYSVLSVLAANPGLSPTALSRALARDKSTVTATLRDLRTHGLVERTEVSGDRRSYGVALTAEGRALLDRLGAHAREHDAMLDAIVGVDKPALVAMLGRIVRGLAQAAPPPSNATGERRKG